MTQNIDRKTFEFITAVQTGLILNRIVRTIDDLPRENTGPFWGELGYLGDAFDAATKIPVEKSAIEAACEFLEFFTTPSPENEKFRREWFTN